MMPNIKAILTLTGMTLQTVDKPLALAMKFMVLTEGTCMHALVINRKG
jgi:hypothetical protein